MEKIKILSKTFATFAIFLFIVCYVGIYAVALMDTTRPTILSVSPMNNQMDVATHDVVTIQFSEPINANTINKDTFTIMQRTTPSAGDPSSEYRSMQIDGIVTLSSNGLVATFKPLSSLTATGSPMQPNQRYGNVFTVTISDGAKDLAGNSLSQDYIWSFTTGLSQFATGAMTSQLDQSFVPTNGFEVAAVAPSQINSPVTAAQATPITGAATGAAQTTTQNNSWMWIIGGLLLLLVVAFLVFALAPKSSHQKNTNNTKAARVNTARANSHSSFGHVRPVIDIEGIGPEHNKQLKAMGIRNTKQLWEADAKKVARETGAPLSSVRSWQNMAELSSVGDIGPQSAEILERSGIHSLSQLKNYDKNKLLKLVHQKQDSLKINIQGNPPEQATVDGWIDAARVHNSGGFTGTA